MEKIEISVCMATYNGEKFIEKQLKSILEQSKLVDEIVISDDNSSDKTIEIIEKIKKETKTPIKILINKRRGVISNFENALNNCRGKYIFLADQDDVWLKNKVEAVCKKLLKYDLVVHNAKIIDQDDVLLEIPEYFKIKNSRKGLIKNLYKNSYIGCCMAFKRKILEKSLPFPQNIPMHDSWIGLVAEIYGKIYFDKEVLFYYRRHDSNVTELINSKNNKLKQIQIRWSLLKSLFIRGMVK